MKKDIQEKALKALEKQEKQYKRQNQYIKNNYYRATITIRKDIEKVIKEHETSVNGYINKLIETDLRKRNIFPE